MPLGPFTAKEHLEIMSLGMEFALTVLAGGFLGYWVDLKWNVSPWCLVAGVMSGFALGLYWVVRAAFKKKEEKNGRC